jgi:NDP-sugar pyrophosphorylase family protein
VILPAGYMPQSIVEYFGDGSGLGMKITYVIEETPLGTAGALKNVQQHIIGPFFVLNGDVLTSLDLRAMLAAHQKHGGVASLHLIRVEDPSAFGCVVHDANGRISAFVEKPKREEAPTNEVNAGTYLLEPDVLDAIPAGRAVSIETIGSTSAVPRRISARTGTSSTAICRSVCNRRRTARVCRECLLPPSSLPSTSAAACALPPMRRLDRIRSSGTDARSARGPW